MNCNLTTGDFAWLAKSFITSELAIEVGLYRVDSITGANLVGRNGSGDYAGIVIPYIWPGEDRIREYRLRRDKPEYELKDGVLKEKAKYLSPPGRGNLVYIPPGTPVEYLTDITIRIVFVEGEKKALALFRYFMERGERVLVIGLPGVWNWKGSIGKTEGPNGERCDIKGVIPDFDRVTWNERIAYIIYDTNVATNENVGRARQGLSRELKSRGADVRLVDLPETPGVNGVDDLLYFKGPDFLTSLITEVDSRHTDKDALEVALQNPPKGLNRERYLYFRDEVLPLLLKIEDEGERLAAADDAAKALGLKAADLKRTLKLQADSEDETDSKELVLHEPELWTDPVNGAQLLDEIATVISRFLSASDYTFKTVALWVIYAYAFDVFDTSPLLAVVSPEKRCGKTTLLTLLYALVPRPLAIANITAAALFRTVEKYHPALLIDEADSFLTDNEELRGILNSGHRKATAYVIRTTGEEHEPRRFTTWTPKAIALIGRLPGTLEDRAVIIRLERKRANDSTERLRFDSLGEFEHLRQRAARWIEDVKETLRLADPDIPHEITNDRARDNWRPLLAIADAAGKDWPQVAREVALASSSVEPEAESTKVLLLRDLKALFDEHGERLESEKIITALIEIEGRPWAEISRGKPISKIGLARLLKPFGITPKHWRSGEDTLRGYLRSEFDEVFVRYIDIESAHSAQPTESTSYSQPQSAQTPPSVPSGNDTKPNEMNVVPTVPSRNTDNGEKNLPQGFELTEIEGIPLLVRSESSTRNELYIPPTLNQDELSERTAEIAEMCGVSDSEAQRIALTELTPAPKTDRVFDEQGHEYNF